jgi:nicotinamidase/pyrazinamidase
MAARKIVFWDVDTQRDFMLPGGNLYVPRAETTIPRLSRLVDAAREGRVFLVSDICTHAQDDPEFREWPPHCIRGTEGAQKIPETLIEGAYVVPNEPDVPLPPDLEQRRQVILEKQTLNVFDNPNTERILKRLDPEAEFAVFGVVTEYCVRLAAKGLLDHGRRVALVTDAIRTLKEEDGRRTIEELTSRGARLVTTDQALQLLHAPGQRAD